MVFIKGIGALLLTLISFSIFSMKLPRGDKAMRGLADAAVATFLVEAIFRYICGDFLGFEFLGTVGEVAGTMGAVAALALVGLEMGMHPVYAIAAAVVVDGYSILSGFLAAYILFFVMRLVSRYLPAGLSIIIGTLVAAGIARVIAMFVDPYVTKVIATVGDSISVATGQSPIFMGLILGGIIKMVCTSPLSSMALTAMLGLRGLPMGIAAIACFGGSFTNGIVFRKLNLGGRDRVLGVMLEPLTQADIITKHPIPIYGSNFFGGALAGLSAALFGIVNDAPGTASPIPGLIAPFAFNPPFKVILALVIAALGGIAAGIAGSVLFKKLGFNCEEVSKS